METRELACQLPNCLQKTQANLRFLRALIAVAETTASAATSAIPASTATAVSASASATTATKPALAHFGPGFIDVEYTRAQLRSVDSTDGLFGFLVVRHFNKAKASRLASITVFKNRNVIDLPISGKGLSKLVFTDVEIQISYIDVLHASLL